MDEVEVVSNAVVEVDVDGRRVSIDVEGPLVSLVHAPTTRTTAPSNTRCDRPSLIHPFKVCGIQSYDIKKPRLEDNDPRGHNGTYVPHRVIRT